MPGRRAALRRRCAQRQILSKSQAQFCRTELPVGEIVVTSLLLQVTVGAFLGQVAPRPGMTPWHFAVQSGSIPLLEYLAFTVKVDVHTKLYDKVCLYSGSCCLFLKACQVENDVSVACVCTYVVQYTGLEIALMSQRLEAAKWMKAHFDYSFDDFAEVSEQLSHSGFQLSTVALWH